MSYQGAEYLPDDELNSLARDLVSIALEHHQDAQTSIGKFLAENWDIEGLTEGIPHGKIILHEDLRDLTSLRLHTDILDEDIPYSLLRDESYTYFDHFTGHIVQAIHEALPQTISLRTSRLIKPIIVPKNAGEQFYAIRRQDLLEELDQSGFVELFSPLDQSATCLGIYAVNGASRLVLHTLTTYLKPVLLQE